MCDILTKYSSIVLWVLLNPNDMSFHVFSHAAGKADRFV